VFILYAVLIGLVLGFVLGGRLSGLAAVDFRWPWLAIGGFLVQVVLFSDAVRGGVGALGPPLYVASTVAVLIAVIRNIRIPGMALVAIGAGCNLAAIVANGGYMPASEGAFAALGRGLNPGYTNSAIVDDPALAPLTDVFALPTRGVVAQRTPEPACPPLADKEIMPPGMPLGGSVEPLANGVGSKVPVPGS